MLIVCGLLLTPMILAIDTRIPEIKFSWKGIGIAAINYKEEEWLLRFRIFFYAKEIQLRNIKGRKKKQEKSKRKKRNPRKMMRKFLAVMKTFRVPVWRISIDTGDYVYNAWLYPLIILSAQSIIKLIFMKRITWFLNCEIILRECSMPGFDNSLTIKF